MPKRPVSGAKMVSLELPIDLVDQMKALASKRGNGFKDEVADAMRRHLAYPPSPLPPPPPLEPLPDAAPKPKRGKK
jgi:hypothetical protein